MRRQIANVVGHYKGKLYAWDVVNEALSDDGTLRSGIWADSLGATYIETAFRAARAADSSALLFYNDYNLEFVGAKQDAAYNLLADFKARGSALLFDSSYGKKDTYYAVLSTLKQ